MNWSNPIFFISGSVGLAFILDYILTSIWPPKEINDVYGYWTKRSKRSQESWNFAQKYANSLMLYVGLINLLFGISGLFISIDSIEGVFLSLGLISITLVVKLITTEGALKQKFGE